MLDMLRPAVECAPFATVIRIRLPAKLCSDHDLSAKRRECLADQLFVQQRTVHFSRVKERDPAFDGRPNQRDPLLLLDCWSEAKAQSHAAQSDSGYFQMAFSKFAFVH